MTEHPRSTGRPAGRPAPDDELADRLARALHARAAATPDPDLVAARIEARLAAPPDVRPVTVLTRRGARVVAAGAVTTALAVTGAGAAAAANPYSGMARAVEGVAQAVGIEWSAMPDGYTREQYDAFWAACTVDDMEALAALWDTDPTETKSRAGQVLLDGGVLPLDDARAALAGGRRGPDGLPPGVEAFWAAGYTADEAEVLAELWGVDLLESKTRAGQVLLDGGTLPVPPPPEEPSADR